MPGKSRGESNINPAARRVALEALRRWREALRTSAPDGAGFIHADSLFHQQAARLTLAADRRLLGELFYGVLRNLTLIAHWIAELATGALDEATRDVLALGLYQTLIARMPDHASVNETVALAGRATPLVNAVLRRSIRERDALLEARKALPVATRFSHPQFLIDRWTSAFGEDAVRRLCEWNNTPARVLARVNTLRTTRDALAASRPGVRATELHPLAVELHGPFEELLREGLIYIQDPSTLYAVDLLDPKPGERILDACAAPGGKAAYAADLMHDKGTVVAADHRADRLDALSENVSRLGLSCVRPIQHDWLSTAPFTEGAQPFDRVLVDAPCTNTGVLRRRADARWRLSPRDFGFMPALQLRLLKATASLLKPGGVLVYSTCSIEPEENDGVVSAFLNSAQTFVEVERVALFPPDSGTDGAFACLLRNVAGS